MVTEIIVLSIVASILIPCMVYGYRVVRQMEKERAASFDRCANAFIRYSEAVTRLNKQARKEDDFSMQKKVEDLERSLIEEAENGT